MTRLRKYFIGSGIMVLLLVAAIYYNAQNNEKAVDNIVTGQTESASVQTKEFVNKENDVSVDNAANTTFAADSSNEIIVSSISQNEVNQNVESDINELIKTYYDVTKDFNTKILLSNTQKQIDERKEIFEKKKEIIQAYENVKSYIKPGLIEDTFIVFTTYDIKLKNIETLVPGMSVLTVVKDEVGKLFLNISPNDDNLNNYINQVVESEDIKEIIDEVNLKLAGALDKDDSLKKFIDYLERTV